MITKQQKRNSEVYWKRGNSFSKCYFLEFYEVPREIGALTAAKVKYDGEEYTLKPEELFGSYVAMFKEKHSRILARFSDGFTNRAQIARDLDVPYSRVRSVFNEGKELGICHEKAA